MILYQMQDSIKKVEKKKKLTFKDLKSTIPLA